MQTIGLEWFSCHFDWFYENVEIKIHMKNKMIY